MKREGRKVLSRCFVNSFVKSFLGKVKICRESFVSSKKSATFAYEERDAPLVLDVESVELFDSSSARRMLPFFVLEIL